MRCAPGWAGKHMARKPHNTVKAYRSRKFLRTPEARPVRILAEYLEPLERFEDMNIRDTILVFGSARIQPEEEARVRLEEAQRTGEGLKAAKQVMKLSRYYEDTRELTRRLTEWSKGLDGGERRFVVCSGGGPGIMEAANRGASDAQGENIGLGISLPKEQKNNPYITRKLDFEFHYFFMRKFWFLYTAKAVVLMPGGLGTLDEMFETLTLIQTGKIQKRLPIVLYGSDFWDRVIDFDALVDFGVIEAEDVSLFHRSDDVDDAFDFIVSELAHFAVGKPGLSL